MSILKVANIHFEAAGTKRIDYLNDDVLRISFGEVVLSGNLTINGNGATKLSVGNTAQRPTGKAGLIRFNTESQNYEGHNGSSWNTIVNDVYVREVGAASNTWANNRASVSNAYADTVATSVGAASNTWANNRASVSNTYAASVGAASNTWTNTVFGFSNTKFLANSTTTYSGDLTIIGTGNVSSSFRAASLGVGTAASGTAGEIRAVNNITAYFSSDKRLKENIRDIHNAVSIVSTIGGKYFDWKDEYIDMHGGEDGYFIRKSDFGVIAQDVQEAFPVAVRKRSDNTLAVDYEKLVALAFAAIKELKAEIDELKKGR